MSELTLAVGGRNYTIACADGQEDHVRKLATIVDGKLSDMGGNRASQEAKNLLFAALLLADELEEARGGSAAPAKGDDRGAQTARALENLADRLERTATMLEERATSA